MEKITIDDFKKVEIRIGEIISAEAVDGSEKLLKLSVNFNEENPRQILSGIAKFVSADSLVGVKCPFVVNLPEREMMGLVSQGMILAASSEDKFTLLNSDPLIPPGTRVG